MLLKLLLLSKETELQKVVLIKKRFNTGGKYNYNLAFEQNCSKKVTDRFLYKWMMKKGN